MKLKDVVERYICTYIITKVLVLSHRICCAPVGAASPMLLSAYCAADFSSGCLSRCQVSDEGLEVGHLFMMVPIDVRPL